ncbi:MAG: 1-acyl-sn-glycerol-3-phosphate acyltransferase [Pseudomonadota bacterium]
MIRSTIFNVAFYSFSFFIAMICWVVAKLRLPRAAMWAVLRVWGLGVIWLVMMILWSRIEVRGRQHLNRTRAQVIVSKHQSELDIVMLGALMWDVSAIAMEELTKLPFFGPLLRHLDIVLIKVDEGRQGRTQQAVDGAKRMREAGRSMVIYPEGELMKLGAKERYRNGAGHIYTAMEVEAVPVAVSLGVIWPRREWRKDWGKVGVIEYLEPIPPGLDHDTFMAEVEKRIETRTMELIEETASGQVLEDARDRHARGANNERDQIAA